MEKTSLNRLAFSATAHCLTGCAIGEVLGLVIGTILGWGILATIALAVVLAFFFGYLLTMLPLLRSGLALGAVLPLAFASDTLSITVMEIVDNAILLKDHVEHCIRESIEKGGLEADEKIEELTVAVERFLKV